jgi:predicted dehydrogenase
VLKVAILGFGFIGRAHGEAYARLPNVKLVAIGGCREERIRSWKAPYPVEFYRNADDLLNCAGADIADICLPTFLHEEFVTKAADKGLHVICEKPLALTVEEVDRMLETIARAGITFMVAQVLRFFPHYAKCLELVERGDLGDVFFASTSRLAEAPRWADWFRDPKKSGGALFDLGVHDLDYLMNVFGPPDGVFAVGSQTDSGCWDHVVSLLSYPATKVNIEVSYRMAVGWPFTSTLRLMGTAGSLDYGFRVQGNVDVMDRAQHSLFFYPNGGLATSLEVKEIDPYLSELQYFLDAVEQGQKLQAVVPEDVRNVIAVVAATRRSLETGSLVDLKTAVRQAANPR